jgi:hypothetical protein
VPPLLDPGDVYAADRRGRLAPAVKRFPSRVYVPNWKVGQCTKFGPGSRVCRRAPSTSAESTPRSTFQGYLNGGVETGYRAAAEVIDALR